MNAQQLKQLRNSIDQLESLDVPKFISDQHPEKDFGDIAIGPLNASQFCAFLTKLASQFNAGIDAFGVVLPLQYNDPEFGNTQVTQSVQNLISQINAKQWPQAANSLLFLIHYQMHVGIWEPKKLTPRARYDTKFQEKLKDIEGKEHQLRQEIDTLRKEHKSLSNLVTAKQEELNQIENLRDSARTNREEIETILQEVQKKQQTLETLVAQQGGNKESIDEILEEFTEKDTGLTKRLESIEQLHQQAETLQEEIEGKRAEIDELTGRAADGSLGHTFRKRFEELEKRVGFWLWLGIPSSFLLGVGWFFVSLKIIPVPSENPWVYFFFLTLKLTPSLILIFWALKQYGRERSFLEEYAFKAAVALTVHAYADELASEKYTLTKDDFKDSPGEFQKYLKERETERKKLIKETVDRLYQYPRVHKEEGSSRWMALRPNAAKEVISEVRALIRENKGIL